MTKIALSLLALALISCSQSGKNEEKTRYVKCEKAEIVENYSKESNFSGRLKAANDINVAFRIAGPISKVYVSEGDFVRKGALLAQMDERDYAIQLSATQAEYNRIKAEADRVIELYAKESVSPNDYDKAVYGLKQITAKLEAHKNALADTRLVAPFDGFVQKKFFDGGETVSAGMPVISMISKDLPEVEINIPTSDFVRRGEVASASCVIDAFGDKEFPLELIGVNKKANLNQLYTTRFRFKNKEDEQPAPGMSAMVTIRYRADGSGIFSVPVTALVSDGDSTKVWVLENGEARSKKVKVSNISLDGRAIIDNGITSDDVVISAGTSTLKEGQKVKALPEKSSTNVGGIL
jgi:RND family efflux transporter MFP subunit